jgi:hypothetical protein
MTVSRLASGNQRFTHGKEMRSLARAFARAVIISFFRLPLSVSIVNIAAMLLCRLDRVRRSSGGPFVCDGFNLTPRKCLGSRPLSRRSSKSSAKAVQIRFAIALLHLVLGSRPACQNRSQACRPNPRSRLSCRNLEISAAA